jgi:hypothetical protein
MFWFHACSRLLALLAMNCCRFNPISPIMAFLVYCWNTFSLSLDLRGDGRDHVVILVDDFLFKRNNICWDISEIFAALEFVCLQLYYKFFMKFKEILQIPHFSQYLIKFLIDWVLGPPPSCCLPELLEVRCWWGLPKVRTTPEKS